MNTTAPAVTSARYADALQVVKTRQAFKSPAWGGALLDLQTASGAVAVFEALAPANQAKFDDIVPAFLVAFIHDRTR